jgi:hypothetical protein
MAHATRQHRRAEHEQHVADDRAGDGRAHYVVEARAQRGDRDDQLGCVAEGGVQEAADAFPGLRGDLLGGAARPAGERNDREGRGGEDPEMAIRQPMLERQGDRETAGATPSTTASTAGTQP